MAGQEVMAKNTEIWVPVKYASKFWRNLEMPLINCETNLIFDCSEDCILISAGVKVPKVAITDTKFYDPTLQGVNRLFVLSFEDNAHRKICR